jgi:hypothetical protein
MIHEGYVEGTYEKDFTQLTPFGVILNSFGDPNLVDDPGSLNPLPIIKSHDPARVANRWARICQTEGYAAGVGLAMIGSLLNLLTLIKSLAPHLIDAGVPRAYLQLFWKSRRGQPDYDDLAVTQVLVLVMSVVQ